MIKTGINIQNGVYLGNEIDSSFSDAYLTVRALEQRVYPNEIVKLLPKLSKDHLQYQEWKLRQKSTNRFINYLKNRKKKSILEIGCGNGWFVNQCVNYVDYAVGVDINMPELEQAASVFSNPNLKFIYWDIFKESPFTGLFDLIVLNASVQYFPDFVKLKNRLLELLNLGGELHIMDSPFYPKEEIEKAQARTKEYYQKAGVAEMSANYHHHSVDELDDFRELYRPETSRIKKLIKGKDMPFGWYQKTIL